VATVLVLLVSSPTTSRSKGSVITRMSPLRSPCSPFTRFLSSRQAVDVAGLKATSLQNIITICLVLGFLAHGFVTEEFEVTTDRLGVYLPVSTRRYSPLFHPSYSITPLLLVTPPDLPFSSPRPNISTIPKDTQRTHGITTQNCADR